MDKLQDQVAKLSDDQVAVILNALAGEFAGEGMPQGPAEQVDALCAVLAEAGEPCNPAALAKADPAATAKVGRELLLLMAESDEMAASLQVWLDNPPEAETASAALILAAPAVIAGCIAVLYVLGRLRIRRNAKGELTWDYDGTKTSPIDKPIATIAKTLGGLMRRVW